MDICSRFLDDDVRRKVLDALGEEALDMICRAVEDAYRAGYDDGYADGYDDGYDDGYYDADECGEPVEDDDDMYDV